MGEILRLASEYQLLCEHTAYLVTDIRAEEFKKDGMPNLRKVPDMLASSWDNNLAQSDKQAC